MRTPPAGWPGPPSVPPLTPALLAPPPQVSFFVDFSISLLLDATCVHYICCEHTFVQQQSARRQRGRKSWGGAGSLARSTALNTSKKNGRMVWQSCRVNDEGGHPRNAARKILFRGLAGRKREGRGWRAANAHWFPRFWREQNDLSSSRPGTAPYVAFSGAGCDMPLSCVDQSAQRRSPGAKCRRPS